MIKVYTGLSDAGYKPSPKNTTIYLINGRRVLYIDQLYKRFENRIANKNNLRHIMKSPDSLKLNYKDVAKNIIKAIFSRRGIYAATTL